MEKIQKIRTFPLSVERNPGLDFSSFQSIKSDPRLLWFCFISVIGPENSHLQVNQSMQKLTPIPTWSLAFSRDLSRLPVFMLGFHCLMIICLSLSGSIAVITMV